MRISILIAMLSVIFSTGCGGSSSNTGSLTGNWQITLTNTSTGAQKSESGFLVQSGGSLSGALLLTGQTACAGVGTAQGSVNRSDVTLSVQQVGQTVNLSGTSTNANASAMLNGNYNILSSPCGNSQVGTWTGVEVKPLAGSLTAVFKSSLNAGSVLNFTGTISQSQNSGSSAAANLSGNLSSQNSTCLSSAMIGGQISGTTVVLNLTSSEGLAIGQYTGTITPDATTITGTYNVYPQAPPGGCHDYGTATITVQPSSGA